MRWRKSSKCQCRVTGLKGDCARLKLDRVKEDSIGINELMYFHLPCTDTALYDVDARLQLPKHELLVVRQ